MYLCCITLNPSPWAPDRPGGVRWGGDRDPCPSGPRPEVREERVGLPGSGTEGETTGRPPPGLESLSGDVSLSHPLTDPDDTQGPTPTREKGVGEEGNPGPDGEPLIRGVLSANSFLSRFSLPTREPDPFRRERRSGVPERVLYAFQGEIQNEDRKRPVTVLANGLLFLKFRKDPVFLSLRTSKSGRGEPNPVRSGTLPT